MRSVFDYSKVPVLKWFPGHMSSSLKAMSDKLQHKVDYVFEVRDARIPFSSVNPQFEKIFGDKKRVIIYNKCDLSSPVLNRKLQASTQSHDTPSVVLSAHKDSHVDSLLKNLESKYAQAATLPLGFHLTALMVGLPNVGKSTLINALRGRGLDTAITKAVSVGKLPGVTRSISGKIKILDAPRTYMLDSPGLMLPKLDDPEIAMKVALTGALKDRVAGEMLIADYLLFTLNQFQNDIYWQFYRLPGPTDHIAECLHGIASRLGYLRKGGERDTFAAALHFIRLYREGFFGRFTLDKF